FLWTHYYDEKMAEGIDFEARGFANKTKNVVIRDGKTYTYYEKSYDLGHVELLGYIGGLNSTASWLSRSDLLMAVEHAGFKIQKIVEDPVIEGVRMPALNILATTRRRALLAGMRCGRWMVVRPDRRTLLSGSA
ncbi:MAG: hypothetical protein CFE32_22975, partial [Alphaproteobacteria bacterium PA3]